MSLLRRAVSALPDRTRLRFIRSLFSFDVDRTDAARCRLAMGIAEHRRAFELIRRAYGEEGYGLQYRSERLHYFPHHLLPAANVTVAIVDGEMVGTMSSVHDSALGLPGEGQYTAALRPHRAAGERLAEGASLAVSRSYRGRGELMFAIVRHLTLLMLDYERADCAVASTNPLRANFLRAVFLFEPLTPEPTPYPQFPSLKTWPIIEDLRTIEARGAETYRGRPLHRNLDHFVFTMGRTSLHFPRREYFTSMGPRLTPDEYRELFGGEGTVIPSLDVRQRLVLRNAWGPELESLFPGRFDALGAPPRDVRFEADGRGTLARTQASAVTAVTCQLRDVSRRGALVRTSAPLVPGQDVELDVEVGPGRHAAVSGRVVRDAGAGRYGIRLHTVDGEWDAYLDFLHDWLWGRRAIEWDLLTPRAA